MGMFDYVKFDPPVMCFLCEEALEQFQTKSSPDQCMVTRTFQGDQLLSEISLVHMRADGTDVGVESFMAEDEPASTWYVYDRCNKCNHWNEYQIVIVDNVVQSRKLIDSPLNHVDRYPSRADIYRKATNEEE